MGPSDQNPYRRHGPPPQSLSSAEDDGSTAQSMEQNRELAMELFKIEQYVEMVLQYLRLESPSSDFVLKHYALDDIVRQAVRKYAKMFIRKKISLDFSQLNCDVLTDEKGFTGYNGRRDKKSTGIGLYLCQRILTQLSHTIVIEGEPGKGTKVKIGLDRGACREAGSEILDTI